MVNKFEIGQLVLIKGRGSWVLYEGKPMLIPAMGHVEGYWSNSDDWGYLIDGDKIPAALVTVHQSECLPSAESEADDHD